MFGLLAAVLLVATGTVLAVLTPSQAVRGRRPRLPEPGAGGYPAAGQPAASAPTLATASSTECPRPTARPTR